MILLSKKLSNALEVSLNDLEIALMRPTWLRPEEGAHPIGAKLLKHRLANNGALPTRMKMFYSWNLSSWTSTSPTHYIDFAGAGGCSGTALFVFKRLSGRVMNQKHYIKVSQGSKLSTHLRLPLMDVPAQEE